MRAILVDDEQSSLDVLEICLCEIGEVTIVGQYTNPLKAINAIETEQVDVVFLDIQMPGLMGLDVARKIKIKAPHVFIIFITAYTDYAIEAFEVNSVDYLLKPFTIERLEQSIKRVRENLVNKQTQHIQNNQPIIQCLGGFFIRLPHENNRLLPWKTNKEKELCAFLIHHASTPIETDVIIDALWPESNIEKAKTYLYTCLSYLRKTLEKNNINAHISRVGKGYLLSINNVTIDTTKFIEITDRLLSEEQLTEQLFQEMCSLYKGEYLERCDFDWAISKKEELQARYIRVLRSAYQCFKDSGNLSLAADSLHQVINILPNSENDAQQLIKLYCSIGMKTEAVKVYQQIEHEMNMNLGLPLRDETLRIYKNLILEI